MKALPNQLYVQAVTLTEVVNKVIRTSTLYYAQRIPSTLGRFKWRIDAKNVVITKYEQLWKEIVSPFLQSMSLREPILQLEGADYSALARYETAESGIPDHLRAHVPAEASDVHPLDIKFLMTEDLRFAPSNRYTGLQMVDFLASAVRRACNGTLRPEGWKGVGRLMPKAESGENCLRFISLEDFQSKSTKLPYNDFVRSCDKECKQMLTRGS
jgi:hypothetical protein